MCDKFRDKSKQVVIMRNLLLCIAALVFPVSIINGAAVVYTDEELYLGDLEALGYTVIHESFEDGVVWAESRNSVSVPGGSPVSVSKGIVWTSNYLQNNIATGTVGGSAPDGAFAIYSLPHGMTTDGPPACDDMEEPLDVCYQNDGIKIESETGRILYAFGGRIDTANSGKVTFLLDGVDINGNETDNIGNWQREGDWADGWTFVGVIDTDGFYSAELRELRGKDWQQVLLFCDDFTIGMCVVNFEQFVEFGRLWLTTGVGLSADLYEDGIVDLLDLELFEEKWLFDCPDGWPLK
jgi:hypothetical protein